MGFGSRGLGLSSGSGLGARLHSDPEPPGSGSPRRALKPGNRTQREVQWPVCELSHCTLTATTHHHDLLWSPGGGEDAQHPWELRRRPVLTARGAGEESLLRCSLGSFCFLWGWPG